MSTKKQYFRDVKPGEVSIEGRQSNGVTADNEGNVFIYSGLKDSELDYLSETKNKDNIPIYYGNSYVAITKSKTHETLALGNNNYETLNEKVNDPKKIITTSPQDTVFDPCKNKNILIVGDSITQDASGTWSNLFKQKQKDKNVKILAISGKQLTSWMKPELEKELKINKYDTVYIYGGVNDAVSKKTTSEIITALQSMVDTVKNSGGQAIVITGYDGEKDMDVSKIRNFKYIKTREEYIPLLNEYRTYQKTIAANGIKGALVIPKVSIGVIGDGFHPSGKQAKKLYEHIINNTPKCGEAAKTTPASSQQPSQPLPTKEDKLSDPAPSLSSEGSEDFIFLEDQEFQIDPTQLTDPDIEYYREVTVNDEGFIDVNTYGYGKEVETEYNKEQGGVKPGKSKTSKQIIEAAKKMIDKAISQYPMIADKTKYPDALNRLLALCLVGYNECRFTPHNENPNHTFNTAKRAKILKSGWDTLETFYAKFGVKAGEEGKKASGNAHTSNPNNIFNASYCCRYENGNEASGDGYKFRGRGYYGITFKSAYRKTGKELYNDENKFINNPDLVNQEPIATEMFIKAMFEGGLCALGIGLLAYTTKEETTKKGYKYGGVVEVTLPNGTKKKIRGDRPSNYAIQKGANNLVNGNDSPGYTKNYSNIYGCQELKDYINSKLK